MRILNIAILLVVCLCFTTVNAQTKKQQKDKATKPKEVAKTPKPTVDENLVWYTSVFKADSVSKKTGKPIFGFFTGSDWCGWCHKLQREVFSKSEFIVWAKEKVVLLELDYPRRKTLPIELQQQNAGLQQALQVQGFPTIWLFDIVKDVAKNDVKINAIGSLGYPSNAVAGKEEIAFLETANGILAKSKAKK